MLTNVYIPKWFRRLLTLTLTALLLWAIAATTTLVGNTWQQQQDSKAKLQPRMLERYEAALSRCEFEVQDLSERMTNILNRP